MIGTEAMDQSLKMPATGWRHGQYWGGDALYAPPVRLADMRAAAASKYAAHPAIARKSRVIFGVLCGTGLCGPDWSLDQKGGGG
jgi:hypothetical protein